MTIHKLRTAIVTLVFLAALATGGGYLARSIAMGDEPRKAPRGCPGPRRHQARPPTLRSPPRAGCSSSAACSTRKASRCRTRRSPSPCGASSCSPAPVPRGAFRRRPATGRATRRAGSGSMRPARRRPITREFGATALAPGYGVGWADLDPDEDQPSAEIRLMPEQVIEGRLFDVHGQPVPGAVVSVSAIWRALPPTVLAQGRVIENHSEGPLPLVGPRPRRAGLAEAGDDRRRRPLQPARHRPRPARQAERPRPAVRPADDRGRHRRPRGRRRP